MKYMSSFASLCVAGVLLFSGCTKEETTTPSLAGTFIGQTQPMGADSARSWVKWDDAGNPKSIGVTFGENALKNLDTANGSSVVLSFPTQAAAAVYNHMTIDWNPKGHPIVGVHTLPHFDFHFYMITQPERLAIIPVPDTAIKLSPSYYPSTFMGNPMEVVPAMGWHLLDTLTPELHGHVFDKTMVWGAYKGNIIFHEPMITKAFLESKVNFTEPMKQPSMYQKAGKYYATSYSITYDATKKEYTVSLDALMKR